MNDNLDIEKQNIIDHDFNIMNEILKEEKERKKYKQDSIKEVDGLINLESLLFFLKNDLSYWEPQGIFDLIKYEKNKKKFAKESNVSKELEYQEESDIKGIDHIFIYQTTGCCEDDYSGWMFYPLNDGKYWKIYYTC